MTGRERVKAAFNRKKVDRTPWVPFVGCHAGHLLGVTAQEYLMSSDLIVKGLGEAIKRYRPDGIPVVFDLQVEAEIFGCDLNWADENPPAVYTHPLGNGTKLSDLSIPRADQGRLKIALDACKKLRKEHPDIALYGLITGPFTLALHLLGTDIFMEMFDNEKGIQELLEFCTQVGCAVSQYYIDAGCDIIAVVDPMTSQIGPDQFRQFITPHVTKVFDHIRSNGALSSFFVCGHAQQNIDAMCGCKPDNVSIDENIPLEFVRERCEKHEISFGGNMQLTSVLLLGEPIDAQRNAIACMDVAGETGFILAPGCDLPYSTPSKNLEAVISVVEDKYQRDVVKSMAAKESTGEKMDMSDYGQTNKVIVDIITLDSEACAPCQYMVDAVRKVAPEFEGIVEWREHKIKYRESLVFMTSLMVRNVPTVCIDGEITFVSQIPPKEKLIAAIQKKINEKLRLRIQQKKGTMLILSYDEKKCAEVMEQVQKAKQELGSSVTIETVTNDDAVMQYGVAPNQTPAIVTARYELRSVRQVPEVAAIKEWMKQLE